jgi:hypothetical protein
MKSRVAKVSDSDRERQQAWETVQRLAAEYNTVDYTRLASFVKTAIEAEIAEYELKLMRDEHFGRLDKAKDRMMWLELARKHHRLITAFETLFRLVAAEEFGRAIAEMFKGRSRSSKL